MAPAPTEGAYDTAVLHGVTPFCVLVALEVDSELISEVVGGQHFLLELYGLILVYVEECEVIVCLCHVLRVLLVFLAGCLVGLYLCVLTLRHIAELFLSFVVLHCLFLLLGHDSYLHTLLMLLEQKSLAPQTMAVELY